MAEKIDIVGGGIAGLTLACLLDPARFEVTLYEDRPDRRGLGTALGMWPSAYDTLRRAGLGPLLDAGARPSTGGLRLLDGTICVPVTRPVDVRMVARTDLVTALASALPGTVRRVTARVTDVAELDADLVVGADGVFSAIRRSAWGSAHNARPTTAFAVRGLVPSRPDSEIGEYWGRGRLFGITPVPGGATNWFCTMDSRVVPYDVSGTGGSRASSAGGSDLPDGPGRHEPDVAAALALARAQFADAAPAVRHVLEAATPERTVAGLVWTAPPMRSYVRGRTVLIGDAAHAMAPNLGRGACESIVDAGVLAEQLNTRPLSEALRTYQRLRLVRSQAARVASSRLAAMATASRVAGPRDLTLRAVASGTRLATGVATRRLSA